MFSNNFLSFCYNKLIFKFLYKYASTIVSPTILSKYHICMDKHIFCRTLVLCGMCANLRSPSDLSSLQNISNTFRRPVNMPKLKAQRENENIAVYISSIFNPYTLHRVTIFIEDYLRF